MFKVKVLGFKAQAYLITKKAETDRNIDIGLKQSGDFLKEEVKASIDGKKSEPRSVKTGNFLNSVDTVQKGNESVTVFSDVPYASSLEYGTSRISG